MKVINCPTKEWAKKVLERFEEMERVWCNKERPTERVDEWDRYEERTCFQDKDNFEYCSKEHYEEKGYEIIQASDYLNEWKEGDVLENGEERKILGICGKVYFMSCLNDFYTYSRGFTKQELDYYKLKTKSEQPVELTIKQAENKLKELGMDVKIIK